MSKYIVEIKPEYEDSFKGLMIFRAKDSNLFVDTLAVDDLEELNSDYINEHFGDLQDEAYNRGLEEGNGAIHKRCEGCQNEGKKIFELPCSTCCNSYPNHYEAKREDKILIGDVVKLHENDDNYIVTALNIDDDDDICVLMTRNGRFVRAYTDLLHKTGKHFDLVGVLKEMDE